MSLLLEALAVLLAAAALGEFVLLRVLLRMGPILPTGENIDGALSWAYRVGLWSLNLGGALALVVLALVALGSLRERRLAPVARGGAAGAALVLLLVCWWLALAGPGSRSVLLLQVAALPAALAIATIGSGWRGWRRGWLWLVLGAYLAASAHYLARVAGAAYTTSLTLSLAEALAVAAALTSPLAFRASWRLPAALIAALAAVLYAGFVLAQPSIASFFVMWDLGLGSAVPSALRALALAGLIYAVVAALARPQLRLAALGLTLVALGGLRLDYTYFSLVAAVGFMLLAAGPRPLSEQQTRPSPARVEQDVRDLDRRAFTQ